MNENSAPGRTLFLFLAVLGVSGAIGLAVMRSSGAASAAPEPDGEPVVQAAPKPETPPEKKPDEEQPTPVAKKGTATKKKVIRWEGGAESDVAARRAGERIWAGPANQAPGRFGSGAVNQPGRNYAGPQFKTTREQLPNGKTRITLYRTN